MNSYENLIAALLDLDLTVVQRGNNASAQCPAHDDNEPSLAVRYDQDAGRTLMRCHAGCSTDDVLTTLDFTWRDLFDNSAEPRRNQPDHDPTLRVEHPPVKTVGEGYWR